MSPAEREGLIRQYAAGPARLRQAIVCHCADSETNGAARIRYVVAEKDPSKQSAPTQLR